MGGHPESYARHDHQPIAAPSAIHSLASSLAGPSTPKMRFVAAPWPMPASMNILESAWPVCFCRVCAVRLRNRRRTFSKQLAQLREIRATDACFASVTFRDHCIPLCYFSLIFTVLESIGVSHLCYGVCHNLACKK